MRYRTTITVSGNGLFPIDMLRYDAATPATEGDSRRIGALMSHEEDPSGPVKVNVVKYHKDKEPHVTPARWLSFGWTVVNVTTDRVE